MMDKARKLLKDQYIYREGYKNPNHGYSESDLIWFALFYHEYVSDKDKCGNTLCDSDKKIKALELAIEDNKLGTRPGYDVIKCAEEFYNFIKK